MQNHSDDEIREMANVMYDRCYQNPDLTLSAFELEEYCTCLSAQMYNKDLTRDEREYIATGAGIKMDEKKALVKVYSHCLGIPLRAQIYFECTHNQKAYSEVKAEDDLERLCQCEMSQLSDYLNVGIAATYAEDYKRKLPIEDDPFQYITTTRAYKLYKGRARAHCLDVHGRRD
ncbi:MAG: hypothetical protein HYS17_08560 [Micavibrio aeruginosavorus]|uniref:Uncharacterized protein n=1 Tax=Micavibrio aeruginosavorus TaxID=349221 RepID=A0A7T5UH33_9BACT|nr:MAG: hypothetical protein HYS17_08560 [Micavibrio aeruginosavorus]